MSYLTSQLKPGEEILYLVNRGRRWFHYASLIVAIVFIVAIMSVWNFLFTPTLSSIPVPGPNDPTWEWATWFAFVYGGTYGFPSIVFFITLRGVRHFFVVEVALTNKRLLGRTPIGRFAWLRRVDIPLEDIESITMVRKNALQIKRKSAVRPLNLGKLADAQGLVDQYHVLVGR